MKRDYDVGVVGAGIIGLAHAYLLARRGQRVVVFERHPRARGASIRNFGMIWPIGQPIGPLYGLARRSRELWREVLRASGLWHRECGSLHLAYREDEAQVLSEFALQSTGTDRSCELWTPDKVAVRFPAVVQNRLRAALWSPVELAVDPPRVIAELPGWLQRSYGVDFAYGCPVLGHDSPRVFTPNGEYSVQRLVICTGADFRELAPAAFADSGLRLCKLQMMRTQPYGDSFELGTHLAAGLTLAHYASFATCPTLPTLIRRLDEEFPTHRQFGIHVLASQNSQGELILGDSHEYGDAIEPFDNPRIDELILDYLKSFLAPEMRIAARWHGIYVKHPTEAYIVAHVTPNTIAVSGLGGAGMTLSFGLAEQVVNNWLGAFHD